MVELNDFYNRGFGWICRQCERELQNCVAPVVGPSRLMREGEAESKDPALSNLALAKWADPAHQILACPSCGITELADKS
ncbi:MAG: hypothetical protein H7070_08195 [Saprospiraceae bacterium]|nr:hypothetical protein [Pyrinomonadaceae bacterium]